MGILFEGDFQQEGQWSENNFTNLLLHISYNFKECDDARSSSTIQDETWKIYSSQSYHFGLVDVIYEANSPQAIPDFPKGTTVWKVEGDNTKDVEYFEKLILKLLNDKVELFDYVSFYSGILKK